MPVRLLNPFENAHPGQVDNHCGGYDCYRPSLMKERHWLGMRSRSDVEAGIGASTACAAPNAGLLSEVLSLQRRPLNLRSRFGRFVSALKIPFPRNGDFGSKRPVRALRKVAVVAWEHLRNPLLLPNCLRVMAEPSSSSAPGATAEFVLAPSCLVFRFRGCRHRRCVRHRSCRGQNVRAPGPARVHRRSKSFPNKPYDPWRGAR